MFLKRENRLEVYVFENVVIKKNLTDLNQSWRGLSFVLGVSANDKPRTTDI